MCWVFTKSDRAIFREDSISLAVSFDNEEAVNVFTRESASLKRATCSSREVIWSCKAILWSTVHEIAFRRVETFMSSWKYVIVCNDYQVKGYGVIYQRCENAFREIASCFCIGQSWHFYRWFWLLWSPYLSFGVNWTDDDPKDPNLDCALISKVRCLIALQLCLYSCCMFSCKRFASPQGTIWSNCSFVC